MSKIQFVAKAKKEDSSFEQLFETDDLEYALKLAKNNMKFHDTIYVLAIKDCGITEIKRIFQR